jgi:antitoxin Phd
MIAIGDKMKTIWKLQDAKAQFSKVVENALKTGPQYVTRRGATAVVVVSVDDYEKLICDKPSFREFLLGCPKLADGFEFKRQKDYPRSVDL